MPLMTKIRESMATVFAVFAGVFVVYIVLDWGMDITGRKHARQTSQGQEVGTINDQPIQYKDFSELVRQTAENEKTQTGIDPDEAQMKLLRDQIWNQLVDEQLYNEEITRLGITVSDQEIIDWVRGDNPPEFLRKQFTDSTGTFNRQAYESAIQDPRNKQVWVRIEDALKKQRLQEKLQSVLNASVKVSEGEVLQKFIDQNIRFEANYALFDPNRMAPDNDIKITDDDLRHYYNDHSDEFKVEASRKLKYVIFKELPSKSDTDAVVTDMEDIARREKAGADFADLAKTYSETPTTENYFKHGELSPAREKAVFSAKAGDLVGPIKDADGYHLIKVLDFRKGTGEFVRASHILIAIENNDSVAALKLAREVLASAKKGESFENLAHQYSKDPGSAAAGGDLGWFGKGRMVKSFDEAAFKTTTGQITGPVRTQFGYHIIKVVARDNREVKMSDILMTIKASSQTKNDLSQRAQDFSYLAKQGNFENEARTDKYTVSETQPFQKNAVIPGFGVNATLNRFAFSGKTGEISEAIVVQNNYGVFMISEAKESGIRPFEETKASIEPRLRRDKKIEKLKAEVAELLKTVTPPDSIQQLKAKRPEVIVEHIGPATLETNIPGIGFDYQFLGSIATLTPSDPPKIVLGSHGVYVVKMTVKSQFDSSAFQQRKDAIRTQLLSEKRSRYLSEWTDQLKKSAKIVDNRDLFYKQ
jgi:peptidyl-prolyl cis-trans isomerase D